MVEQWMVGAHEDHHVRVLDVYPSEAQALDNCPTGNHYFVEPVTIIRYREEPEETGTTPSFMMAPK